MDEEDKVNLRELYRLNTVELQYRIHRDLKQLRRLHG